MLSFLRRGEVKRVYRHVKVERDAVIRHVARVLREHGDGSVPPCGGIRVRLPPAMLRWEGLW